MNIEKKNVKDLLPADYNPRKDLKPGDPEYEKLKRSIEQFGYVEPVIWNEKTGRVVGGHQRLKVLTDMAGGEAGAEAILPLKGFYTQLAQMLDERLNMAGMERYLAIIADNSSKGIYLEDGTLVGHLLPAIDSGLAKYSMRGGRGNR